MINSPPLEAYLDGLKLPAGVPPQEWDEFHTLTVNDQMSR